MADDIVRDVDMFASSVRALRPEPENIQLGRALRDVRLRFRESGDWLMQHGVCAGVSSRLPWLRYASVVRWYRVRWGWVGLAGSEDGHRSVGRPSDAVQRRSRRHGGFEWEV